MGREIKRVPIDFDWPIGKVWEGYVNRHYSQCKACRGMGLTTARRRLEELTRLILLSGEDANQQRCHPYFQWGAMHHTFGISPSQDMNELSTGLAGREPGPFGHDGIDARAAQKKIISAAGLDPNSWGICKECEGSGEDPATKEASDAWSRSAPPTGDAFQLWSTTTEGHPMSPPMRSPDALARWLAENKTSSFGESTATYEQWLSFIGDGFAPSMVAKGGRLVEGVKAASMK